MDLDALVLLVAERDRRDVTLDEFEFDRDDVTTVEQTRRVGVEQVRRQDVHVLGLDECCGRLVGDLELELLGDAGLAV